VARGGGRPGTRRAEGDGFFIDFPSEKTIKKVEEEPKGGNWVFLYKDECTLLFSSPRGDQALEGEGRTRTDKAHKKWAREDAYSRYFSFHRGFVLILLEVLDSVRSGLSNSRRENVQIVSQP
jgi:hypothetical protein